MVGGVVGALLRRRPVPRAGPAQPHHAQGAHLRAHRWHRRRTDDLAPEQLGGVLAGTTASAGCATRQRRSSRCACGLYPRRANGATGCCAPWRARRRRCRSCTARASRQRLTELVLDWLPGYEARRPYGSATPPPTSSSSTSSASWWTRCWPPGRHRGRRRGVAAPARPDEPTRRRLGAARRGDLEVRQAPPLRAFQGHGVGGVRPGDPVGRAVRA